MAQQIANSVFGAIYVNETDSNQRITAGVYVNETSGVTTVNATLSVTLDNTTLTATASTKVNAALTVLLDNTTLTATAHLDPTVFVQRGGPRIRYVPEFDFRTLRTEFRKSADERVVLEEVVEAAQQAIETDQKALNAAKLAEEIKRQHDIRLTMKNVERMIVKIRNDKAFRAEAKRIQAHKQMMDDEDDALAVLLS